MYSIYVSNLLFDQKHAGLTSALLGLTYQILRIMPLNPTMALFFITLIKVSSIFHIQGLWSG